MAERESTAERRQIGEREWREIVRAARELEPAFLYANIGEVWIRRGEEEIGCFYAADYAEENDVVVMFDGDPEIVTAAFERLRRYAAGQLLD